ncbi:MAG: cytochrome o ubiquinol oxidase subunit I [Alphaproteobacteria bacterium]
MFGKFGLDQFATDPIALTAGFMMPVGAIAIALLLTVTKRWGWLWREWLTTVDHKKIGIMYLIGAFVMLVRGFVDAVMMRAQQAIAIGPDGGFLPPEHYDQIFTAHGFIMVFLMAMPFMAALINLAVPLQIGARDVAFPFLNALSFWLFAVAAMLMNLSLFIGAFAHMGWLPYPPLAGKIYSPNVGVDYYIWITQISGIGTTLFAVNFFTTIVKMRAPGMTWMKMPIFTWSAFISIILAMAIFPIFTGTMVLLWLDRYFDFHIFTNSYGGNPMMFINLIWAWGHPEVYVLVMPAFGIYSEIVATFCRKKLFGQKTMIYALVVICFLSFIVWAHHFFTMGAGPNVNAFFGIATMIIAVPTGVKMFNWLFTMYKGRIKMASPMYWFIGFVITFSIGGMTGVMLSIPAADFQFHNSLFLIAHFHNTILGGVVFAYLAGLVYWFPKFFGFKLHEGLGKCAFFCWLIGFFVAFMPIYYVGLLGAQRRLNYYDNPEWQIYFIIAAVGVAIIALGVVFQVLQLVVSIINRKKPGYIVDGDPWDGRTLEWSIPSPAPFYNFARTPVVKEYDDWWEEKQDKANGIERPKQEYLDIHMPKNTGLPLIMAIFAGLMGFSLIFHMNVFAIVGLIGILVVWIIRSFDNDTEYFVKAEEIERIEAEYARR